MRRVPPAVLPKTVDRWTYEAIRRLELAHQTGTTIIKLFLHIDRDEQRRRLQARYDDPTKHWKFKMGDLEERKRWDDYMAAYEDAIHRCNTAWAPWHIVPANKKWYRNLIVSGHIVAALEEMRLKYPAPRRRPDRN